MQVRVYPGFLAFVVRSLASPRRSLNSCKQENYPLRWNFGLQSRFHSVRPGESEAVYGGSEVREGEVEGGGRRRRVDQWKAKQKRFSRHITNLVRKGKVEEAEDVFHDMLAAKVRPTTAVFNNLISGLSRSGHAHIGSDHAHSRSDHAHRAFKYFNDLKKRRLMPTNHTYTSLFKAFTEMGPTSRPLLEKVVAEVDRRDFLLNTIATNSMMVAMTTCGMSDEVFRAYGDVTRRGESPDVGTFTALLAACSLDRERGLEKTEQVWREMTALQVSPDLVCYHTLLKCLRTAGIPQEMRETAETEIVIPAVDMRELLSIVPEISRNRDSFSETGQGNTSEKLVKSGGGGGGGSNVWSSPFKTVSNSRVTLRLFGSGGSPLTLHMTGSGWRWLDQGGVALVLSAMREGGAAPDGQTLYLLSKMAADWPSLVREVMGGAWSGVGGACDRVGGVSDRVGGANTERGVASRGDLVERYLYSAIEMQLRLGNRQGAEVLRQFGSQSGVYDGPTSHSALALGCSSQQEAQSLLSQMKVAGVAPNCHMMGILLREAAARLDYEYLTALMKEMRHSKLEPDVKILKTLAKVADGRVPQNRRMKLRFNGFKGYYTLWKKHYPQLESRDPHVLD